MKYFVAKLPVCYIGAKSLASQILLRYINHANGEAGSQRPIPRLV